MAELGFECHNCSGTGTRVLPGASGSPDVVVECQVCSGTGKLPTTISAADLSSAVSDILDKINDVLNKCDDIIERLG